MRIDNIRRSDDGDWAGIAADVTVAGETRTLRIQVPGRYEDWLAVTPDPFLAMCAPLAADLGERDIHVEHACPQFVEGVRTALDLLALWYPDRYRPAAVIHNHGPAANRPIRRQRVSASFLSGGIDSLSTLRHNLQTMPAGHPARIAACITGNWGLGDPRPEGADIRRFDDVRQKRLEHFGAQIGVDVVTVRSDYRSLIGYVNDHRWADAHHGLVFAALAHALGGGIHQAFIASSNPLWKLRPWGSHPLLDQALRSGQVQIVHDGMRFSRLDKIRMIAAWPQAAAVINVCVGTHAERADNWNCGTCEKCIRTAAGLVACGADDAAERLLGRRLTPGDIDAFTPPTKGVATAWTDMAEAFADPDLARAARRAAARYRRTAWKVHARRAAGPAWPVLKAARDRARHRLGRVTRSTAKVAPGTAGNPRTPTAH